MTNEHAAALGRMNRGKTKTYTPEEKQRRAERGRLTLLRWHQSKGHRMRQEEKAQSDVPGQPQS